MAMTAGCAGGDAEFATKYAPNMRRDGMTVSVFGVYKDGRMSAEAWTELAPRFASALGGAACESLQADPLVVSDRPLASALDDVTRADGVNDELLDVFAPAASGDALLLVTISGHPPSARPANRAADGTPAPYVSQGKQGRGVVNQGRNQPASPNFTGGPSTDVYSVSAALFSVKEHHIIALVAMSYTGKSIDAAMVSFVARLRVELPNLRCQGWKPDAKIDAERVRLARPAE